eukprot:TRINITY_DN2561_c0_g3_i1.p1 TRINITY_DN2561_c0_g3~~TRINITY_DN2561_c0_g3_i1.p1  ORF type:complete len:173 (-),score=1.61 TRINITY_DN2561_c0_g3_i1:56-574(-)
MNRDEKASKETELQAINPIIPDVMEERQPFHQDVLFPTFSSPQGNEKLPGPAYTPPAPQFTPVFEGLQLHQVPMIHGNMSQGTPMNFQIIPTNVFFSRYPQPLLCTSCGKMGTSMVRYTEGSGTCIMAGALALCGLWAGCCLIPCCLDDCKDVAHLCPYCDHVIGRRRFLFD